MDFFTFRTKENQKGGTTELYPGFKVGRSTDLMVRGGSFYAIWDEKEGLWSTDEYRVAELVDQELANFLDNASGDGRMYVTRWMRDYESGSWAQFQKYLSHVSDSYHTLDQNLTFANSEVKKNDYVSRRLPYPLGPGDHPAWDELVGTLYSVEERAKIEWFIGAIVSGDSKKLQKFAVFYGPPGSGKGTILEIVLKLFVGYTTTFDSKALGSNNAQFATDVFRHNPLVAIQGDGDLSKIEDNARLNMIVSHELMPMNEKFKSTYTDRVNAILLMGTNKPVKISDAKSGIIRRLVDIHPTGVTIPINHYLTLMGQIDFELGAIAHHCLEVYRSMGKNHYSGYRPMEMMLQTDVFFNFIEANFDIFKEQDGTTLQQAYLLYKEYCENSTIPRILPQYKFREELRNYFEEFKDREMVNGHLVRSYYKGFNANKFKAPSKDGPTFSLVIEETESLLDEVLADMPAQYASYNGKTPAKYWTNTPMIDGKRKEVSSNQICNTVLSDLDTSQLHFVKVPQNHIVIDFDLKGEDGEKSLERNLEAASVWPPTYAELSKGGGGVHLHYIYEGEVSQLSASYSEGIEVKTLLGDASLRRRLTKCNNVPIATMMAGPLPIKEKKVLDVNSIQSERHLRTMIVKNLNKEFGPGTKSSIDFIKKLMDEAHANGVNYDVSDLQAKIYAFALGSTNQAEQCIKTVKEMKFKQDETFGDDPISPEEGAQAPNETPEDRPHPHPGLKFFKKDFDERLVFYDIEVYPNLFVVCWKYQGDTTIVKMINPKAHEIEGLLKFRLVGFNNRRYDNHILYAAFMGYDNAQIYKLSQRIINNDHSAMFGPAYNLSYADIYDFSSKKQGLKKFQVELGIPHKELDIPWDQPVPEEKWPIVVDYCCNDVLSTEAVFEARKQDFVARKILADLSGLSPNDTTQKHTAAIIFGKDRNPQRKFVYTELNKEFPGYTYIPTRKPKSDYRDEDPSEGGYVYDEPGIYENVVVLDVASMHPTSIVQLNLFGTEYTKNFKALLDARLAIKHEDFDAAKKMLDGKLEPHLGDPADADALAYALKIVINIVYGLTSASFDNPFRDRRNKDNIVAKRGALFMIDLKHFVQEELGKQVVHIKTDSIKVPDASEEDIRQITEFGAKYGYDFEHEATYDRFCLVDKAQYIARYGWAAKKNKIGTWEAVGAKFQHPYIYKTLFSGEDLVPQDFEEPKSVVQGSMYLDFEHDTPMVTAKEGLKFVGRTGLFTPVEEGQNGAVLYRVKDDKHYAVTGTKGFLWMESEMQQQLGAKIDMSYFEKMKDDAIKSIEKYGSFEEFVK